MKESPHLSIQWHITTKCGNRCKHCYMYDGDFFEEEKKNTLSLDGMVQVLDSIGRFEKTWGAHVDQFYISGGDPLLREDWKDFVRELRRRGKNVSMMGNPETLTEPAADFLSKMGVKRFQMSLDGLQPVHDSFRSSGSFDRTVEKISLLEKHGISSGIMFTLFPDNADQLFPLLRFLARNTPLSSFTFDLGCSVGNATQFENHFLPEELQRILSKYLKEKATLQNEGYKVQLYEKSHFLRLTHFENEEFYPSSAAGTATISGCLVGWACTPILSDGTVLACRRMPLKVGKMPEQSFEEVLLGSELLKKFRRPESFAECGNCDFYQHCRGCPALAFGLTGDPFAKNPVCFRSLIPRKTPEAEKTSPGPPLNSTFSEEFALLTKRHSTTFPARFAALFEDEDFQSTFVDLTFSSEKLKKFSADPQKYLKNAGRALSDPGIVFLVQYFKIAKTPGEDQQSSTTKLASAMVGRMLDRILS